MRPSPLLSVFKDVRGTTRNIVEEAFQDTLKIVKNDDDKNALNLVFVCLKGDVDCTLEGFEGRIPANLEAQRVLSADDDGSIINMWRKAAGEAEKRVGSYEQLVKALQKQIRGKDTVIKYMRGVVWKDVCLLKHHLRHAYPKGVPLFEDLVAPPDAIDIEAATNGTSYNLLDETTVMGGEEKGIASGGEHLTYDTFEKMAHLQATEVKLKKAMISFEAEKETWVNRIKKNEATLAENELEKQAIQSQLMEQDDDVSDIIRVAKSSEQCEVRRECADKMAEMEDQITDLEHELFDLNARHRNAVGQLTFEKEALEKKLAGALQATCMTEQVQLPDLVWDFNLSTACPTSHLCTLSPNVTLSLEVGYYKDNTRIATVGSASVYGVTRAHRETLIHAASYLDTATVQHNIEETADNKGKQPRASRRGKKGAKRRPTRKSVSLREDNEVAMEEGVQCDVSEHSSESQEENARNVSSGEVAEGLLGLRQFNRYTGHRPRDDRARHNASNTYKPRDAKERGRAVFGDGTLEGDPQSSVGDVLGSSAVPSLLSPEDLAAQLAALSSDLTLLERPPTPALDDATMDPSADVMPVEGLVDGDEQNVTPVLEDNEGNLVDATGVEGAKGRTASLDNPSDNSQTPEEVALEAGSEAAGSGSGSGRTGCTDAGDEKSDAAEPGAGFGGIIDGELLHADMEYMTGPSIELAPTPAPTPPLESEEDTTDMSSSDTDSESDSEASETQRAANVYADEPFGVFTSKLGQMERKMAMESETPLPKINVSSSPRYRRKLKLVARLARNLVSLQPGSKRTAVRSVEVQLADSTTQTDEAPLEQQVAIEKLTEELEKLMNKGVVGLEGAIQILLGVKKGDQVVKASEFSFVGIEAGRKKVQTESDRLLEQWMAKYEDLVLGGGAVVKKDKPVGKLRLHMPLAGAKTIAEGLPSSLLLLPNPASRKRIVSLPKRTATIATTPKPPHARPASAPRTWRPITTPLDRVDA